jgi:hypothetical protein
MPRYYEPDLTANPNSLFVRDAANKLFVEDIGWA